MCWPLCARGKMHPDLKHAALIVMLALILGGCATAPDSAPVVTLPQSTTQQTDSQAPQQTDRQAPQQSPVAPIVPEATANNQRPPASDLWERIRRGFALTPQADNPLVSKWVLFYSTHLDHLLGAAERARPYLWHIVKQLDRHDMPMELALLPIVESAFKASAESHAGAAGLWQFMPITADRFGLEQNWWYDGRHAALPSTRAALDYLGWLHGRFQDWLLALAAYNAGAGRVDDAIEQAIEYGKPTDFWHLDLPTETENFVPKLLALREILVNPARFAIDWPRLPNKQLTTTVSLPSQVELDLLAEMMGMDPAALRQLNPAYRRWATAPTANHKLLVPIDKADALRVALANADPDSLVTRRSYRVTRGDSLYAIAHRFDTTVARLRLLNGLNSSVIHPGDRLLLPAGGGAASYATAPPRRTSHTVSRGESLWSIANAYGTSVATLRQWNHLGNSTILHPGQRLRVPAGTADTPLTYQVQSGDSLWSIANSFGVSVAQLSTWNNIARNDILRPGQVIDIHTNTSSHLVTYQVKSGDSLWSIASRFSVQVAEIKDWNGLASSLLRPGQELHIIVDATS